MWLTDFFQVKIKLLIYFFIGSNKSKKVLLKEWK